MTCLTLKKYILNLSVLISIYCVIVSYHICCNLTLHHTRLSGISAYIIQLIPLHQILSHWLSIKENNRYIFLFCHLYYI